MPAMLDTMSYYGAMPWHGEGVEMDHRPDTFEEMRKYAGLEWEPQREISLRPILGPDGEPLQDDQGRYLGTRNDKYQTITRSDRPDVVLSSVKDSYHLITHAKMGEIIERMLKVSGVKVAFETAGSLYEGAKVWALAVLGDDDGYFEVPGDFSPYRRYLAALNDHTGRGAFKVVNTTERIVCANTYQAADIQAERDGTAYTFRHTKNWEDTVEDAVAAVMRADRHSKLFQETATHAAQVRLTDEQWKYLVAEFATLRTFRNVKKNHGIKSIDEVAALALTKPSVATSLANTTVWFDKLEQAPTNAEMDRTALKFWNIVSELECHTRDAVSPDSYLTRNLIESERNKRDALHMAMALA